MGVEIQAGQLLRLLEVAVHAVVAGVGGGGLLGEGGRGQGRGDEDAVQGAMNPGTGSISGAGRAMQVRAL